uniref:Uncharacterized protein n=1 Tax=Zea mays TaxID=4577 RepID=A0A804PKJ9_MAIZE
MGLVVRWARQPNIPSLSHSRLASTQQPPGCGRVRSDVVRETTKSSRFLDLADLPLPTAAPAPPFLRPSPAGTSAPHDAAAPLYTPAPRPGSSCPSHPPRFKTAVRTNYNLRQRLLLRSIGHVHSRGVPRARAHQRRRAGVRDDGRHALQRGAGHHARRHGGRLLERVPRRRGRVLHRPRPGVLRGAAGPPPHGGAPRAAGRPRGDALPRGALLRPPGPRPRRAPRGAGRRPRPPGGVRARARAGGRHGRPRRARRRLLRRARRRRARLQLDARGAPPRVPRPRAGQRRGVPGRRHAPGRRAGAARPPRRPRRRRGRLLRAHGRPAPPLPRRARPPASVVHRRRPGLRRGRRVRVRRLRELQGPAQRVRRRRLGPQHGRAGRLLLRAARLRARRRRQAPVAGRHRRAHGGHDVPAGRLLLHQPARLQGQERRLVVVRRRHAGVARGQARGTRRRDGGREVGVRDQPVRRPRLPRPPEQRRRRAVAIAEQAGGGREGESARRGGLLPEARHVRRPAVRVDGRRHLGVQRPRPRAHVDAAPQRRRRHLRLLHRRRSHLRSAQRRECLRRMGDAAAGDHLTVSRQD